LIIIYWLSKAREVKKMLDTLDRLYIGAQIRKRNFIENFKNDESGVSNFVATVLLILMVVLIGGAVWGFLSGYFTDMFQRIKTNDKTYQDSIANPYGGG